MSELISTPAFPSPSVTHSSVGSAEPETSCHHGKTHLPLLVMIGWFAITFGIPLSASLWLKIVVGFVHAMPSMLLTYLIVPPGDHLCGIGLPMLSCLLGLMQATLSE